jgi:hypothetical protein
VASNPARGILAQEIESERIAAQVEGFEGVLA